jgi:predicted kinase
MLEIDRITVAEVPCVLEDNSRTLDSLKKCVQSRNNRNERKEAVEILADRWRDDIGFLELLGDRAWIDRDPEFRDFAQRKLTELKGGRKDSAD